MSKDYWGEGLELIADNWNLNYGFFKHEYPDTHTEIIEVTTGGWSENEEILNKLCTTMFWNLYWQESKRGGYYKFQRNL